MSVTKQKRLRKARDAAKAVVYSDTLKKRRADLPAPEFRPSDYYHRLMALYRERAFNTTFEGFRPIKTRDHGRIRLAAALYAFGKFAAPRHLQEVFHTSITPARIPREAAAGRGHYHELGNGRGSPEMAEPLDNPEAAARIAWFVCVASGGSLFKSHTNGFLTKKETHAFITCPLKFSFSEALVYAIGKSTTDDVGVLTRLAKSKLTQKRALAFAEPYPIGGRREFWKDGVRFFASHPKVTIQGVNDLIDFFEYNIGQNGAYTLKGRTLESLNGQMIQWHRDLSRVKRLGNQNWEGVYLPDTTYARSPEYPWVEKEHKWSLHQIKSSKELGEEGNKMHHCVYSYQRSCISGSVSIWSLRLNDERAITIELNNRSASLVQIRGYANRPARPHEMRAIQVWASENGLSVGKYL